MARLHLGGAPIANRDLLYTIRQLNDIQNGARSGSTRPDAAGGRQIEPRRHDLDRGLPRHAEAVSSV
jgi:hypothetical protein